MKVKSNITIFFLLFLITLIILSGCKTQTYNSGVHSTSRINAVEVQKESPSLSFFNNNEFQLPIPVSNSESNKVIGWLDNDEILYSEYTTENSNLYIYDLNKGKSNLIFQSEYPIISINISPDQSRILIHSSKTSFEGHITLINTNGDEVYSGNFPSVEMTFEWNQYDLNLLLITAFKEDWSFTNYLLKIEQNELSPITIRKPFAKWTGKETLAFLDWKEDDISILSPLIQTDLNSNETLLEDDIFQFDSFRENRLIIIVDSNENEAHYDFYDVKMNERAAFEAPVLTSYSGWFIPEYEISSDEKEFFAILPLESAEADTYNSGFEFISYNLESMEKTVLIERVENVPFTCSPNKEYCLMGYELEKIYSFKDNNFIDIF